MISLSEKKGGLWVDLTLSRLTATTTNNKNNNNNNEMKNNGTKKKRPSAVKKVIFRANCDGLAVNEATSLPFASTGFMHACGHDFHMAMLLGAMKAILTCTGSKLVAPGVDLRFVFQRAEENPITQSGGDMLVNNEGICNGIHASFGLHVLATGPLGVFSSKSGPMMANSDRLKVVIQTSGQQQQLDQGTRGSPTGAAGKGKANQNRTAMCFRTATQIQTYALTRNTVTVTSQCSTTGKTAST